MVAEFTYSVKYNKPTKQNKNKTLEFYKVLRVN